MPFSTETITEENAAFVECQHIGTATQLCRHTGEVLHENVRFFIAVMRKVPDDEIPTINAPEWEQEAFMKESRRIDELGDVMRQNAGIADHDSVWTTEEISEAAINEIFKKLEHWERAFETGDTFETDHRTQRFTNIQRL